MITILDTDIGGDLDDTWALAVLLKLKEYDVKLISIVGFNTIYQVQLTAKILTLLNRTDIDIAYNIPLDDIEGAQQKWSEDFDLSTYKGRIYKGTLDPMSAIVNSYDEVCIFSIGANTNIAELIRNNNSALQKCKIVSMQCRISGKESETNTKMDIISSRQVTNSGAELYIMPTEVCGNIKIKDELYQKIKNSNSLSAKIIMENYKIWWENCIWNNKKQDIENETSVLFDVATVLMLSYPEFFKIEQLNILIDQNGITRIDDEKGKKTYCAVELLKPKELNEKIVEILLD